MSNSTTMFACLARNKHGSCYSMLQNYTADFQKEKQVDFILSLKGIVVRKQTGWISNNDKTVVNVDYTCFHKFVILVASFKKLWHVCRNNFSVTTKWK